MIIAVKDIKPGYVIAFHEELEWYEVIQKYDNKRYMIKRIKSGSSFNHIFLSKDVYYYPTIKHYKAAKL